MLTPLGYLAYVLAVRWLQGNPLYVEPLLSTRMGLYFLVLALTGVLVGLDWNLGLRATSLAAVGGLLVWPWVYISIPIGNVGYVSIPFVCVLFATAVEGSIRFPERFRQFSTGSLGRHALGAGLLHFVLGFALQVFARRFFWLEYTSTGLVLMGVVYVVSGLGLVATGALPVVLWRRGRLVTPGALTTGWFVWGVYGTWKMRESLPWGAFDGISWVSLQPYPDYMLKWTMLMVGLFALGGFEWTIRKGVRGADSGPAE